MCIVRKFIRFDKTKLNNVTVAYINLESCEKLPIFIHASSHVNRALLSFIGSEKNVEKYFCGIFVFFLKI